MRNRLLLVLNVAVALAALPTHPVAAQTGKPVFRTSADQIQKDGQEFVIHGININGPGYPNHHKVTEDAELIARTWKFNTVRVACKIATDLTKANPKTDSTLDEIVQAFTARGIVVIVSPRDHIGGYYDDPPKPDKSPGLSDLVAWYKPIAEKYRSNPYVWFEVQAGPGNRDERVIPVTYRFEHETILKTIRSEASAGNIVICEGYGNGDDDGNSGALPTKDNHSAILSLGVELTKAYSNLAFSFHCSETWNAGAEWKLNDMLDRTHARNLPVFVSEFGLHPWAYSMRATEAVFAVGKARHLGHIVSQWTPTDRSILCCTDDHMGGWDIDVKDGSRPGNLSWLGDRVWIDNHVEPFHGPMLDRSGWTASSFTGDKPKNGYRNQPDGVFAEYAPQEDTWCSDKAQDPGQWFMVDMGAPQKFTRIMVDTGAIGTDYMRGYELYASSDGMNWGKPIAAAKNDQSVLRISFPVQTARYLRLVQTGKHWRYWRIGAFEVYAPFTGQIPAKRPAVKEVALDMHGWQMSGKPDTWYDIQMPLRPRTDEWERATSNKKVVPGDYYQVDMQKPQKIHRITLNSGHFQGEYPRGYALFVSNNGTDWGKPLVTGRGAPITNIQFTETTARYIRIQITRGDVADWVICELQVYGEPAH